MAIRKPIQSATTQRLADNEADRRREAREPGDVAGLQKRLQSEIARQQPTAVPPQGLSNETAEPQTELHPAADRRQQTDDRRKPPARTFSKLVKSIIGIAVVAVVGWIPVQRLFETSSVQAVMNATVVTVRSPIAGIVGSTIGDLSVGKPVSLGKSLATIENSRVDTTEVNHAADALAARKADLIGIRQRIAGLEELRDDMTARVEIYRKDRAQRLAARIAEANARIAHASAERDLVSAEIGRLKSAPGKSTSSKSSQKEDRLRIASAEATVAEAEAAKLVLVAEQAALEAGRFLGDDYNDAPRSAQRVDDINEMLVQLRADESRMLQQQNDAQRTLVEESEQLNPQRFVALDAPVGGRVWEVLTAPGEQVAADQPLVSLVDCSRLIVTAAVSESVYNFLSLGWNVNFLMDGSKVELPGTVVQLSGVAAAGSNFAIDPSALTKEAYRVGIAVDTKQLGNACPVGRTGRVVFKNS